MQTSKHRILTFYMFVSVILLLSGCRSMSEHVPGDDNKMNGSFEIVKNNLPVNWRFYTSKTVQGGDFDIIIDSLTYKEGKQSLKFLIRNCDNLGGWHSPGFFSDFNASPDETYKVSFWVKNQGSSFQVTIESTEQGKLEFSRKDTIIKTGESILEWKYVEHLFKVPHQLHMLRFEANIFTPGTIWFDDIQIMGTDKDKGERTLRIWK